jgi:hypothetical protein
MKRLAMAWALLALACGAAAADEPPYTPTAEQTALAEQLRMPAQPPGRNAYALLWSLEYDITPEQAEYALKADRDIAAAWAARFWTKKAPARDVMSFPYAAAAFGNRFPAVSAADNVLLCSKSTPSCLDHVRSHAAAVHAVLSRHQRVTARVESLASYDIWWNTMPADPMLPAAQVQAALKFWNTVAALRFVEGDPSAGLSTACTAAATFRRLHAHTNTQLDSLFAAAGARLNLQLATDMLSAMPAQSPLPEACRAAFAPVDVAEVNYQAAAAYEWLAAQRTATMTGGPGSEYGSEGWALAVGSDAVRRAILEDGQVPDTAVDMAPMDEGQVGNALPLADIRGGRIHNLGYLVDRRADYVATLRMAALMAWLHEHPSSLPLTERLAAAPVGVLAKRLSVGCQGGCLVMTERKPYVTGHTWPVGVTPAALPRPAHAGSARPL